MGLPPDVSQPAGLRWVEKHLGGSFVTVQFDFSMLCDNNTAAAAID